MQDKLQEYLNLLVDPKNPVYFSLLLTLALFFLLIFTYKYIVSPLRKKHILEKKELEIKNVKLMALFAELDPNPLIRINEEGEIIHSNDAAKELSDGEPLEGNNISKVISTIKISIPEFIKNNESIVLNETINNRYYSILIRGISYLNIAQIYFDDLTERKTYEEQLQESKNKLKELSGHLRDTLEDERQRIARELHDSIGQNLNLVKIKLLNNDYLKQNNPPPEDKDELLETLESSINELKEITYDLKPKLLEERGLGASLEILVKKITEETGICGSVDITGKEKRPDKKIELTLYRLAQESINNIIKHSKAKAFNIQLIVKENLTKLLISDDGIGFDISSNNNKYNSGFGLLNMNERVEAYGGKLKIDSSPGSGTVIIFEIPDNE